MPKVIILCGAPASGKTTWSKKFIQDNSKDKWKRINRDDLREMLDNYKFSKGNEKFITSLTDFALKEALRQGYNVVVDNTHLSTEYIEQIKKMAEGKAEVEVKYFPITLSEAIVRDKNREKKVGVPVLIRMHKQWEKLCEELNLVFDNLEDDDLEEIASKLHLHRKNNPNETYKLNLNNDLPNAVIFDIDGCLAINQTRGPFEENKVKEDLVNEPVAALLKNYHQLGYKIIVMSGRQDSCRQLTEEWFYENNIPYDALFMRRAKDVRKDAVVKKELYDNNIKGVFNIFFVADDRNQVVDMWRKDLNLPCFQVYYGDF